MEDDIRFMWDTRVPMRDGVKLSTDIYLPAAKEAYPVILARTPYDNIAPRMVEAAQFFSARGYAVVLQDARGRFDSEGHFEPRVNEGKDGYDTIEWIAEQPWSNGKIGMMGGSYGGTVQWLAARERPPHLTTVVTSVTGGMRWMHDENYMNGKFPVFQFRWLNMTGGRTMQHYPFEPLTSHQPGVASPYNFNKLIRTRPLKDVDKVVGRTNTYWRTWLERNTYDEYWQQMSFEDYFELVDLPALHITGWFDNCQWGEMYMYSGMAARSPGRDRQWLLVGPWDHAGSANPQPRLGDLEFTQEAVLDIRAVHLRWFDYWLKGEENGQADDAKVRIFTMGRNRWRDERAWPVSGMEQVAFYLHSGGAADLFPEGGRQGEQKERLRDAGFDAARRGGLRPVCIRPRRSRALGGRRGVARPDKGLPRAGDGLSLRPAARRCADLHQRAADRGAGNNRHGLHHPLRGQRLRRYGLGGVAVRSSA